MHYCTKLFVLFVLVIAASKPNKICVVHAQNQSMAAGTAFAISYQVCSFFVSGLNSDLTCNTIQSDIKQVTPENLVVFSVRYQ